MSYNVLTDPSGALLQDISGIVYTNYNVNYIPDYNKTYQLRNSVGKVVADNFYPFISPTAYTTPHPYLAHDTSNNIYITKQATTQGFNTVAKIVNNTLVDLNFTLSLIVSAPCINGITFDSSGALYITTSENTPNGFSRIFKVELNDIKSVVMIVEITNMDLNNTDLRGLDFDSLGNLYIADRVNNNILKLSMITYNPGSGGIDAVGSIFLPSYTGLNGPLDIKFDEYDNAYIANSMENNIIKVTPSGVISVFATGLLYPTEITYNMADSVLYSTNYGYSQSDSTNTYIGKIVNGVVTNIKQVSFPYGIVATTTGEIYYTSSDYYNANQLSQDFTNKLYQMIPNNYTANHANLVSVGFGPSEDVSIRPITSTAFNATQVLHAAQYADLSNAGAIWTIDSSSPYDPLLVYPGSPAEIPLINPTSIAYDSIGNLYIANSASNNIVVLEPGAISSIVDISGVQLSSPSAIVFDGSGRLYVANSITNTICILTFSDVNTATSVLYDISGSPLGSPAGLDFDASYANLYVSNAGYNNILKIPLSTSVASIYNLHGVDITSPSGILFDNSSNILYVSDLDTNQIIQITNNNTASNLPITQGNSISVPTNPITLNEPMGLTLDTSGNMYISNYANFYDPIVKLTFDNSINLVNTTGLSGPTDTAIGTLSNKNIFISNALDNVVYKLNASNILTTYVDISYNNSTSLTINNGTGRIYVLGTDGEVQSIRSTLQVDNFIISVVAPSAGAQCIRFRSTNILYIADTENFRIIKVTITNPNTAGTGSVFPITGLPATFKPTRIAFDSNGTMYISAGGNTTPSNNSKSVYKINMTTFAATAYITLTGIDQSIGIVGIAFDSNDYMYTIGEQNFSINYQLYRTTPNGVTTQLIPQNFGTFISFQSLNYISWENALILTDSNNNRLYKVYLSYSFTNMYRKLGPYDDTLFIFQYLPNTEDIDFTFDVSFNVYNPYVVISPRTIPPNVPTEVSFHFVTPYVIPAPTDSYILQCNSTDVSKVFCNNCTYNKEKFLAGTYPTGLVYSTDTTFLYVALQNNTISRVSILGVVDNNYFPPNLGLDGPTSLVLDASFDMFVLNAGSDFISYLTLRDNIISIDNSFFTGIYVPICLTYDTDTDSLYLLSGAVPNTRITRIDARTGAVITILPIPFGALYDPNGLTIDRYHGLFSPIDDQPPTDTKYLYVSNTDQNGVNTIKRINITDGVIPPYQITTLISGLTYKPFTMATQNDGFLYVANKTANNLSKISLTGLEPSIQPWAVNGISVPVDLCFDNLGDLFVANSGTSPRNSRVSKIYTNYFFFTDVKLATGTCDTAEIFDITTQSCVEVDYYPAPADPCIFPIPIPYPIGS